MVRCNMCSHVSIRDVFWWEGKLLVRLMYWPFQTVLFSFDLKERPSWHEITKCLRLITIQLKVFTQKQLLFISFSHVDLVLCCLCLDWFLKKLSVKKILKSCSLRNLRYWISWSDSKIEKLMLDGCLSSLSFRNNSILQYWSPWIYYTIRR